MVKKTAIFLILIFMIQTVSGIPNASAEVFRDLAARSAILVERETGIVLYENNIHVPHPADALAKIITLLIAAQAIENDLISDNELITMTEAAWEDLDENSSTLDIHPDEVMTFIDLMYCSYVGNANEASNMLALRIAGSISSFVSMMNEKAVELGAVNTRFTNPHGLYSESQYTTASDQYHIFNEAMKSSIFAEISSTYRHITESNDDSEARTISSSNELLNQRSRYYYRNCISGRDSATYEGGYSLVAYAEEEGLSLISVVLGASVHVFDDGQTEVRNFSESLRLFQWGYNQFAWRDVLKTTDLLARVPIQHGSGADFVNARPLNSLSLLLNNSITTDSFIRDITIFYDDEDNPLTAPVNAGDVLGEVIITRDGIEYAKMPLVANTDISLSGFEYIKRQVTDMLSSSLARNIMIVLALLLFLYIILVIRYNIVRANRLRRIKNAKSDIIRDRHENFRD